MRILLTLTIVLPILLWGQSPDSTSTINDSLINSTTIESIEIKAQRERIRQEADRIVLDINGSNALGNNASEILEQAPGVRINESSIELDGQSAAIWINGRPSKLSSRQLMQLLQSQSAQSIAKIELIPDAGAMLSAEANGRIIHIELKRLYARQYLLDLSHRTNQRSTIPAIQNSIDYYQQLNRWNLNLSLSHYHDTRQEISDVRRSLPQNLLLQEHSHHRYQYQGPDGSLAIEYQPDERQTIALQYQAYLDRTSGSLEGRTDFMLAESIDSTVLLEGSEYGREQQHSLNLFYDRELDSLGSYLRLNLDADHRLSAEGDEQFVGSPLRGTLPSFRQQDLQATGRLLGAQLIHQQNWEKTRLQSGLQFTHSLIDQAFVQEFPDLQQSDSLHYQEQIAAAWMSFQSSWLGWNWRLGLRAEQTWYQGNTLSRAEVDSSYLNLFPNLLLSRNLGKDHFVSLGARRSIRRPRFHQLLPSRRYVSPFYYYQGNPGLQAYFPARIEVRYQFKRRLYTRVAYGFADQRILEYSQTLSDGLITEGLIRNNGQSRAFSASIGYNGPITDWLRINSNMSFVRGEQRFEFRGKEESTFYQAATLYLSPQIQLPKDWRLNLSFYGSTPVYYQLDQTLAYGYLDFRLSRNFFDDQLQASFSGRDLFKMGVTRQQSTYGNVDYFTRHDWDSRQWIVQLSYQFGNDKAESRHGGRRTANDGVRGRL
ncbi:MAG: outer membrane beta-barrel family protein [Bacteroidota bacterium]